MNFSKLFTSVMLVFLVYIFVGCVDESRVETPVVQTEDAQLQMEIKFNMPQNHDSKGTTRALSDENEKAIKQLRVLIFNVDGSGQETFAYEASVQSKDQTKAVVLLKTSTERCRAVLIVNAGESFATPISEGMTKAEVLKKFIFESNNKWNASSDFTPLPMWGESNAVIISGTTPLDSPFDPVHLTRSVARIDVGLCLAGTQFDEQSDKDNSELNGFQLSSVSVYNTNNKGNVARLGDDITKPSIPTSGVGRNGKLSYTDIQNGLTLREIYVSEVDNSETLGHMERPFIVIGGTFKGKQTYYRLDFLNKRGENEYTYLHLLRNYRYLVNVTRIGGKGFDTEEEAAASTAVNIAYDVTVWNESSVTKVVYDGQYMLGVSEDNLTYYNHAHSKDIIVHTSWPAGWKAMVTQGEDWITISPNRGEADKDVTLSISVGDNSADDAVERNGVVTITAGRMTWNVNVKQLTDGELSLEIYEFDTDGTTLKPEPISIINFTGQGGTKKIAVKYAPGDPTKGEFSGIDGLNLKLQDFKFTKVLGESVNGKAVYNVKVEPMSNPDESFESISDVANFTIRSEGKMIGKALMLQQTEYNAVPFETTDFDKPIQFIETIGGGTQITHDGSIPFFLLDGQPGDNFVIKANTRYNIKMKSVTNKPQVKTSDNQGLKLIESGFPLNDEEVEKRGKFAGEKLEFTTANDLQDPKRFLGYVEFEITSPDGLFAPRTFKLLLASGIMQKEANTYLMKPGYIGIIIPVSQIDKAANYYNSFETDFKTYINQKKTGEKDWENDFKLPTLDKSKPWTVEVLWAEVMNTYPSGEPVVSGTDPNKGLLYILTEAGRDYIFVMPSYNYTGNVIIGLKQEDKIMWSWHLWLVDTYPSENPLTNVGPTNQPDGMWKSVYPNGAPADMKWLDRDLGAFGVTTGDEFVNNQFEEHGLVYQWGRKDPFPLLMVKNKSVLEGTGKGRRNTKLIDTQGNDYFSEFCNRDNHLRVRGSMKDMINNPTIYYSAHKDVDDVNYRLVSPFLELPDGNSLKTINNAYTALWGGVSQTGTGDDFIRLSTPTKKTPFDPSPYGWKVPNGGSEVNWGKYRDKISTIKSEIASFYKQETNPDIYFPNMSAGDSEAFRWHSTRLTNNVRGRYCSGIGDFVNATWNGTWSTSAGIMVRSVRNEKEADYENYLPEIKVKK